MGEDGRRKDAKDIKVTAKTYEGLMIELLALATKK